MRDASAQDDREKRVAPLRMTAMEVLQEVHVLTMCAWAENPKSEIRNPKFRVGCRGGAYLIGVGSGPPSR